MRPQVLAALATVLMIVLMAPSVQADEPSRFTEPGNEYRVLQVDEPGKIVLDLSVNDGIFEIDLLPLLGLAGAVVIIVAAALLIKRKRK